VKHTFRTHALAFDHALSRGRKSAGLCSSVEKFPLITGPQTLGLLLATVRSKLGLPRGVSRPKLALLAIPLEMAVIPAITNAFKVALPLQPRILPASVREAEIPAAKLDKTCASRYQKT
jgi:hypothetical protein